MYHILKYVHSTHIYECNILVLQTALSLVSKMKYIDKYFMLSNDKRGSKLVLV